MEKWAFLTTLVLAGAGTFNPALADSQEVTPTGGSGDLRYFDGLVSIGSHLTLGSGVVYDDGGTLRLYIGDNAATFLYDSDGQYRLTIADGGSTQLYDANGGLGLSIAPNGYLGVNTATPSYDLDVAGDVRVSDILYVGAGGNQNAAADIRNDDSQFVYAAAFDNDGGDTSAYKGISIQAGDTDQSGPNVGYYLWMADGDGTSMGYIAGWGGSVGLFNYSDPRLKSDIAPTIVDGLEVIDDVDLVEFRYARDGEVGRFHDIGFNAENLEVAYPDAVLRSPDGYLAVDSRRLIPILVKAVQELADDKAALERELQGLKALVCQDHAEADSCR